MVPDETQTAHEQFVEAHGQATDALLDKLMEDDLDEDAPQPAEEEAGAESDAEDDPEAENSDEAGDVAASDDSDPASPKEADHELEAARQRLQLTGITTAVLDRMTREETVEAWSNRATYQAEIDRAFRERAELKTQLETLGATNVAEPAQAEPTKTFVVSAAKSSWCFAPDPPSSKPPSAPNDSEKRSNRTRSKNGEANCP